MTTIHLNPDQVPFALRGNYTGKMFKARVVETVTILSTAGLWDGGSRDTYKAVELVTGREVPASDDKSAPWDKSRSERTITLRPGFAVVEHSIFCGKDMGLTFYVHPDNAAKLIPVAVELMHHERIVLNATKMYKSSCNGQDRYDMAHSSARYEPDDAINNFPTRTQWEAAKQSLISRGMLNKAGAITNAGRNALPSKY